MFEDVYNIPPLLEEPFAQTLWGKTNHAKKRDRKSQPSTACHSLSFSNIYIHIIQTAVVYMQINVYTSEYAHRILRSAHILDISVNMCLCIQTHVYIFLCNLQITHTHIYIYLNTFTHSGLHIYVYMFKYAYLNVHSFQYVGFYVHIYVVYKNIYILFLHI